MRGDSTLHQAAVTAEALGNPTRLRILQLLFDSRPKGLIVSDIQNEMSMPGSTLSHHLERLRAEGLVSIRRHGTFLWYRPNEDHIRELAGFLLRMTGNTQPTALEKPGLTAPAPPEVEIEFD